MSQMNEPRNNSAAEASAVGAGGLGTESLSLPRAAQPKFQVGLPYVTKMNGQDALILPITAQQQRYDAVIMTGRDALTRGVCCKREVEDMAGSLGCSLPTRNQSQTIVEAINRMFRPSGDVVEKMTPHGENCKGLREAIAGRIIRHTEGGMLIPRADCFGRKSLVNLITDRPNNWFPEMTISLAVIAGVLEESQAVSLTSELEEPLTEWRSPDVERLRTAIRSRKRISSEAAEDVLDRLLQTLSVIAHTGPDGPRTLTAAVFIRPRLPQS
jgi:hypothetical protein